MTDAGARTCPNCGRSVEIGFKFCDHCGTRLEESEASTDVAKSTRSEPSAAGETPEQPTPPVETSETREHKPPLVQRWRERRRKRRDERAEGSDAAPSADRPPLLPTESSAIPSDTSAARPTSQVKSAEDLRSVGGELRSGISGRLRWRDGTQEEELLDDTAAIPVTTVWRPVGEGRRSPFAFLVIFLVHLVIAFVVGAVLLAAAGVVASFASDGRVALLEIRGLPIFIAGASAIVVFALLRTSPKRGNRGPVVAASVVAGLVILVAAVAVTYRPSAMTTAESRLEKAMGLFGPKVTNGVKSFEGDVDQWNAEVTRYRDDYLVTFLRVREAETDPAKFEKGRKTFEFDASGSEEALDSLLKRMRSDTDGISHAPIRESLDDLVGVFGDELSGIKLLTRGLLGQDDQALIQAGNTRYREATKRAVDLYETRVRPLLERGGIDADPLGLAIEELRG